MNKEKHRKQQFVDDVERTLQQQGEKLSPEVIVKLSAIRSVAVESRVCAFAGFWRLARLPVVATMVAAALFAMVIVSGQPPGGQVRSVAGLADMDILQDTASPEFYSELDFYIWLAGVDDV